jgi:acetyl esterase
MSEPYSAAGGLVRVYPAPQPHGAGLVWAHGGGFAFGDLDMPEADWVARSLAAHGTTVISVDYRLAPVSGAWASGMGTAARDGEHYPAASDDVISAWLWAVEHAPELGVDVSRLAIGGASAGANIATGAVLRLLERGESVVPSLVALAYPTLLAVQPAPDAALRAALDAQPGADRFGPESVRSMYENYLGGPVDEAPIGAVPGLATADDLADFPPTLIINGEVDELQVSANVFATTLRAAGRPVEVVVEPGTEHGHLNRPDEPAASASIDRFARALAALAPSETPAPSEILAPSTNPTSAPRSQTAARTRS